MTYIYTIPTKLPYDMTWKPKPFGFYPYHKWNLHLARYSYRGVMFYCLQVGPFRLRWKP